MLLLIKIRHLFVEERGRRPQDGPRIENVQSSNLEAFYQVLNAQGVSLWQWTMICSRAVFVPLGLFLAGACPESREYGGVMGREYWVTSQCVWGQSEGGQLNVLTHDTYGQVHCPTQHDNSPRFAQDFPSFKAKKTHLL